MGYQSYVAIKATGNSRFETAKFPPPTKTFPKIRVTENE